MLTITIIKITIVSTCGTDMVYFTTDLPSGIWPFDGKATMKMEVAAGRGKEYVETQFPGVPYEFVDGAPNG